MLFEIVGKGFAYGLVHGARHLAVAKLGLGLALKLRLGHLYAYHGSEAFAEVFSCNLNLRLLYLFLYLWVGVGVVFQYARKGHAESRDVRATLYGIDVVDIGVQVFRVIGIVHYRNLDRHVLLFSLEIYHVVEQVLAVTVDVSHKLLESVLGMEHLLACLASLGVGAEVGERYLDARVQVGELTHAA